MVTQQREEEIKEPPLWLAGLMKPRWLLCCLIVCEIKIWSFLPKLVTSQEILFPSSFLVFSRDHQPFSWGFLPPEAALPAGRSSLGSVLTCQTHTGPRSRELLKCVGEKRDDAETHREIWSEGFQGELLPNLCSSSPATSAPSLFRFPLSYPHSGTPSREKESGFWEWITFSTLPSSWASFLFGNSARNHTYATENPTKSVYFKPRERELKDKYFARVRTSLLLIISSEDKEGKWSQPTCEATPAPPLEGSYPTFLSSFPQTHHFLLTDGKLKIERGRVYA